MSPNIVTSTIAGVVILAVVAVGIWLSMMGLQAFVGAVKDESTRLVLLAAPILLFFAYFVGHGFLEYRQMGRRR
jgi:hypothetical protein